VKAIDLSALSFQICQCARVHDGRDGKPEGGDGTGWWWGTGSGGALAARQPDKAGATRLEAAQLCGVS